MNEPIKNFTVIHGDDERYTFKKINDVFKEKTNNVFKVENNNRELDIKKWWNSYLALTKKADTDGRGYEHTDIISTTDSGCLYYINEFTSNVPLSKYPRILDIGAGDGGETYILKERGYNVTGITIGEDNVTKAKEQYNIDLINTDMNCLNFPINSFDGIMMIQAFEHFLSPFIACIEIWRVLRVGGLCYIDVPSPSDLPMWCLGHTNLLHSDQLENMFSMCGFEVYKNLSTKHRPRFIFKKMSISKIRNWDQLRYIIRARNEV